MKSKTYWTKRMEKLAKDQEQKADELVNSLEKKYKRAMLSIEKDIEVFYLRYAEAVGISYAAARKLLTNVEKMDWDITLEEYRQMALDGGFEKELDAMYAKSRISRLEAINTQIRGYVEVLHNGILNNTKELLEDTFTDTYYRTIYELQKGTNLGISFTSYNQDAVNKILSKPWKYGNFSSNLWNDKAKLIDELETNLAQSFIRGDDVRKTIKNFSERMRVDKYRSARIIQTESAYISGEASAKAYKSQGIDEYEFLATLDLHTSKLCQSMDGKVFKISQKETGVNYPPLHSFCRSTTIPYFEDDDSKRAARIDGKTFYVDGDMSYNKWHNEYVAGKYTNGLENNEKGLKISFKTLEHSNIGEFTNPKNPKKSTVGKFKSGGHGQDNILLLNNYDIEYTIVKEYKNGVRIGNVPSHKMKSKKIGTGQAWFPKKWSKKQIEKAGLYVTNLMDKSKYLLDVKRVDEETIAIFKYANYKNVTVGICYDCKKRKVTTIFPDEIQRMLGDD
ncbi:minor capsid protein [Vallitalea sp.]|uniref:minor capsid protein n=1 Tax=Vallitalea sp. TaxID=1882829 RepID=UPI0025DF31FE|nr:minor capsid protein [Vallitalea sp.]MCT4686073.1 minor capsid protein [Vallitalea sp.]